MKIAILLALTLGAVYVAQAHPQNKEEGYLVEQEQNEGNIFLRPIEQDRLKRAACTNVGCIRFCDGQTLGACRNGGCECG